MKPYLEINGRRFNRDTEIEIGRSFKGNELFIRTECRETPLGMEER